MFAVKNFNIGDINNVENVKKCILSPKYLPC